jgi:hypothetical protein
MVNLSSVYSDNLEFDEATEWLEKAIKINPKLNGAYVNLAYIQHLRGDHKTGFLNYEHRLNAYITMQFYINKFGLENKWDGNVDLNGKRVIVYGEQGFGDVLQFSRFLLRLKKRYPDMYLILSCPTELVTIFEKKHLFQEVMLFGIDEIIHKNSKLLPTFDYHVPLLSLPHLMQDFDFTNQQQFVVEPHHFDTSDLKVGLCWKGSPLHPYDKKRSIPLVKFFEISQISGIQLYGLQLNHDHPMGVDALGIIDLMDGVNDFCDTAKLISGLDLVITVDTSILHLAGLLGVETWALLPYKPDWRWGLEGNNTPWYSSVKLFRQKNKNDWSSVLEIVQTKLREKRDKFQTERNIYYY